MVLAILVLNILDALFTLDYISKGGSEANPLADSLLQRGDAYFIYAKCLLVAVCLVFLLLHKTFRFVSWALCFLVGFYGILLVYHIYLQVAYYISH